MKKLSKDIASEASSPVSDDSQGTSLKIGSLAYSYAHAATSENTREAYRSDVRQFIAWGGFLPATPDMVIRYLEDHAQSLHPNTLKRRLTALKNWHTYQKLPDPTEHELIRKIMSGISRTHGKASKKAPTLSVEQLRLLSDHLIKKDRLIDWRDNALLQIGFFGAFRRSELVAIQWEHVKFVPKGVEIFIARSKTDQEGAGHVCAIPYGNAALCPVTALQTWGEKSKRSQGSVFTSVTKANQLSSKALSPPVVSLILRKLAIECKLPNANDYSAHSLRRGFATSASEKGAGLIAIMRHGRWQSERTVIGYIEEGQRFEDNVASILFNDV
jgi:site-specific recombinase XerD